MATPVGITRPDRWAQYGKHLVYFPSRKNHKQIICDSVLEGDYCVHLEWDNEVISYSSQPGELEVTIANRPGRYRPDFRVDTADTTYFTEVKFDFTALRPREREKLLAAQQSFAQLGYTLAYADNNSIRKGSRLQNLKFLYFQSFNTKDAEAIGCLAWLRQVSYPVTLRQLIHCDRPVSESMIYKALFKGQLVTNLDTPLYLDSVVEKLIEDLGM
ncbi:hypothetical protein [Pseudomonas sp. GZD-209]|uniref:hypothetical protein n=1 Tax=Pseudomonas sp. GZD-209 TaxID=3404807 RepID=UPI003BB57689